MPDTPNDAPDRRDDAAQPNDARPENQASNPSEGGPEQPVDPAQEQRAYQPPAEEDPRAGPFGADRPHDPAANAGAAGDGTVDVGHAARRPRPGFGARRSGPGARGGAAGAGAKAGTAGAPAERGGARGPSRSTSGLTDVNEKAKRRQQVILAAVGGVLMLSATYFVASGDGDKKGAVDPNADGRQEVAIDSGAMVNKVEDNKTWMAQSSNRLNMQDSRLRQLEGGAQSIEEMQREIAALKAENSEIQSNGQQVVAAYEVENRRLRAGSAAYAPEPAPAPEPFRAGPASYGSAGGYDMRTAGMGGDPGAGPTPAEVKIINFMAKAEGAGAAGGQGPAGPGRPDAPPVVLEDSPEYLPPNSYARARVIVGVDASAGVNSQSDPLPVVLRITGPARSVVQNGRVLTTRIQGCVINGAARGDLSSEKVYIKLNKMTCDQPGGRVAVSEVKGFISFGGKAGVRGRVVSREGALVGQALLAGIAGGFGRGFSANTNAALTGVQVTTGGQRPRLGAGDIIEGGLGNGVAEAGDMVSRYLIERAEQYQPIIEMPTGIDVDVVFLDGAYVRTRR